MSDWILQPLPVDLAPVDWFQKIRHLPYPILLDSQDYGEHRRDIVTAMPEALWQFKHGTSQIWLLNEPAFDYTRNHGFNFSHQPFSDADYLLQYFRPASQPDNCPFPGGLIGYFGYDTGRYQETLPEITENDLDLPDAIAGIYQWAIVIDKVDSGSFAKLMFSPSVSNRLRQFITSLVMADPSDDPPDFHVTSAVTSNFSLDTYKHAFMTLKDYIQAGDCYQVNLAQRFSASCDGDPWHAYHEIVASYGGPYSAYLDFGQLQILSFSPELFLSVTGTSVLTRPIKGTRPRSTDPIRDLELRRSLLASEKDQAENLMIVDLLRNDLGKCCLPGSIKVEELFGLHSFDNVHHLISTIRGELPHATNALSLLSRCFPGGSITGAPKIRAMEIIEELEPHRRGPYCGTIGYCDFNGDLRTNIAIRTMVVTNNQLYFWGGGGVVADSDADAEYQETLDKVSTMLSLAGGWPAHTNS